MSKKVYFVRIPIAGIVSNYVAADSEKEAVEKALADSKVFGQIETKNNWELDELDTYKYLFHGNIDYTNLSEASAEESDELDPEDLE